MTKKQVNQRSYSELREELDDVISKLQTDNGSDIDETIRLHARGEEIVAQLQKKIKEAENIIINAGKKKA